MMTAETYENAFVVEKIKAWLKIFLHGAGEGFLINTVASNGAIIHAIVMDIQKIL